MNTLVLWFHPDPARSRTGRALADAAARLDGVTLIDMGTLYPTLADLDADAEVKRLYAADRLVLQFPIHWYLPPPLLAAWQNTVLTRMFYVHPEDEGARLAGLPVMVAATAGNVPEAYSPGGVNLFPLGDLLNPLRSTANRCSFRWTDPFIVFRANRLNEAERAEAATRYAARLTGWAERIERA